MGLGIQEEGGGRREEGQVGVDASTILEIKKPLKRLPQALT
jgi:hypothetical protein